MSHRKNALAAVGVLAMVFSVAAIPGEAEEAADAYFADADWNIRQSCLGVASPPDPEYDGCVYDARIGERDYASYNAWWWGVYLEIPDWDQDNCMYYVYSCPVIQYNYDYWTWLTSQWNSVISPP